MALPPLSSGVDSIPNLTYNILQDIHSHATLALQPPLDKHQIVNNVIPILDKALPILEALEEVEESDLLFHWIERCIIAFTDVSKDLRHAEDQVNGQYGLTSLSLLLSVQVVHTGHCGCPRKVPNPIFLQHALSTQSNIQPGSLAKKLGIHQNTLCHYMQHYNIDMNYTDLSDDNLDKLVHKFRLTQLTSGLHYLSGAMRVRGIRVQKCQLAESLHWLIPLVTSSDIMLGFNGDTTGLAVQMLYGIRMVTTS
jgi:hypothetical protein